MVGETRKVAQSTSADPQDLGLEDVRAMKMMSGLKCQTGGPDPCRGRRPRAKKSSAKLPAGERFSRKCCEPVLFLFGDFSDVYRPTMFFNSSANGSPAVSCFLSQMFAKTLTMIPRAPAALVTRSFRPTAAPMAGQRRFLGNRHSVSPAHGAFVLHMNKPRSTFTGENTKRVQQIMREFDDVHGLGGPASEAASTASDSAPLPTAQVGAESVDTASAPADAAPPKQPSIASRRAARGEPIPVSVGGKKPMRTPDGASAFDSSNVRASVMANDNAEHDLPFHAPAVPGARKAVMDELRKASSQSEFGVNNPDNSESSRMNKRVKRKQDLAGALPAASAVDKFLPAPIARLRAQIQAKIDEKDDEYWEWWWAELGLYTTVFLFLFAIWRTFQADFTKATAIGSKHGKQTQILLDLDKIAAGGAAVAESTDAKETDGAAAAEKDGDQNHQKKLDPQADFEKRKAEEKVVLYENGRSAAGSAADKVWSYVSPAAWFTAFFDHYGVEGFKRDGTSGGDVGASIFTAGAYGTRRRAYPTQGELTVEEAQELKRRLEEQDEELPKVQFSGGR